MARGFKSGVYLSPAAGSLYVRVEADRFADAAFGWVASPAGAVHSGYGTMKPRHVVGVEAATGKVAKAIVPDATSDIWTGVATSFTAKDDDGAAHTYVVTSRVDELVHILR